MKVIYQHTVSIEEALDWTQRDCLRHALVDEAWKEAARLVDGFSDLDSDDLVGECSVEYTKHDFIVKVHDLREQPSKA